MTSYVQNETPTQSNEPSISGNGLTLTESFFVLARKISHEGSTTGEAILSS